MADLDEILYDLARKIQQDKPLQLDEAKAKINRLIVEAQQELLRKLSNHRNFIYWGDGATSDLDNWIDKQKQELSNNLSKGEV